MNRIIIAENFDQASEAEVLDFIHFIAESRDIDLEKAVKGGGGAGAEFEEWFLKELFRRSRRHFSGARDQMWRIVERYLRSKGGLLSRLTPEEMAQLERILFEAGLAHTSHMVGISVRDAIRRHLERWGRNSTEILDLPGWAYRFAVLREVVESRKVGFDDLVRAAASHPLSEAEVQAIAIARQRALNALQSIFNQAGRLMTDEVLKREQELLRRMVVEALEERKHPLTLARDMFKVEAQEGLFRDFERVARTEIADTFAQGAFEADRKSGKFEDDGLVYRTPRAAGCKICLALFSLPDGTPRLYRVKDLEEGTAPAINIGVRKERLYRATVGIPHPNCLCSPWLKYHEAMRPLLEQFAPRYREGRQRLNLEVKVALPGVGGQVG